MTARTRIGEPQRVQRKGSTSYTFASSRAQSLAVSGETAVDQGAERVSMADTA